MHSPAPLPGFLHKLQQSPARRAACASGLIAHPGARVVHALFAGRKGRTPALLLFLSLILVGGARAAEPIHPLRVLDLGNTPTALGLHGELGGHAFYLVKTPDGGELLKTNGLTTGTLVVKSFSDVSVLQLHDRLDTRMPVLDGNFFFFASTASHGRELWKSDGTSAGTVLLKDIYPGAPGCFPYNQPLEVVDDHLYFAEVPENPEPFGDGRLWASHGTTASTTRIYPRPGAIPANRTLFFVPFLPFEHVSDQVIFVAYESLFYGMELFKSNGTTQPILVKDINPDSEIDSHLYINAWLDFSKALKRWNGTIYLAARNGAYGEELWRTQGSAGDTYMVKDIRPGPDSSGIGLGAFFELGGQLCFVADDGVHGSELWTTDGTLEGTQLLLDLNPGLPSGFEPGTTGAAMLNGDVYFTGNNGESGWAMWKTDGTAEGTVLLKDLHPDTEFSGWDESSGDFCVLNGALYFVGSDGEYKEQIWKTDGTPEGTVRVTAYEVKPGDNHLCAVWLRNAGGKLVFAGRYDDDGTDAEAIFTLGEGPPPPPPPPPPLLLGRMINLSTRGHVGTGDDVLIGGFIVEGPESKTVVVRGRGPSLAASGVTGTLGDPALSLFSGATELASNDNWDEDGEAAALGSAGLAPPNANEAAIHRTLEPGAYTVIVSGAGGTSGTGIVEVFDRDDSEYQSRLMNISTRASVKTGDGVMIGGFIIDGTEARTVVLRARGPSLAGSGISGTLADPYLRLFSGGTQIDFNDDWQGGPRAAEITASGLAPSDARESALYRTLSPGAYTVIVEGVGGTVGIGIVEAFDITEE